MEERLFEVNSEACTRRRIETKCDESFSAAPGERRGAHRLDVLLSDTIEARGLYR